MVIIFKKGSKKDLKNYRPISLLSNIYKVLTKVLTKRLEKTLNENQPQGHPIFRSRHSMTDHIHVINQLKEKWREYTIPHCTAFINYNKAFDSVQNSSSTDLVSKTGDRRCVHRTPEGYQQQELDDSPPTQRKQQDHL